MPTTLDVRHVTKQIEQKGLPALQRLRLLIADPNTQHAVSFRPSTPSSSVRDCESIDIRIYMYICIHIKIYRGMDIQI